MEKGKTIKYLENTKRRAEKMVIDRFLKSMDWTNKNLETYLDGLGLAYRKGFIDAVNDFGNKNILSTITMAEMEEIISNAIKKTKRDFYKEITGGKIKNNKAKS